MARVTVEDCLKKIHNRFILANIAAKRTKQLLSGAKTTIAEVNNKMPVLALREIADGSVRVATEEEATEIREKREAKKQKELGLAEPQDKTKKIDLPVIESDSNGSSDNNSDSEEADA